MESSKTTLPEGAKAQRVYLALREEIVNSTYPPGQSLPGEHKLAKKFSVSRVTVRRALGALSNDGLVRKHASIGTLVCQPKASDNRVEMDFSTLMPQLAEMSRNTSAQLLSFTYGSAPEHVSDALGLDIDATVQKAIRVRSANDQPFSHLTTYVPESIASSYSEQDLASTPMFELLERSGIEIDNAHQSVTATLASPAIAEALGVAVGSALLSLQRVVCDKQGRGVEFLSARYRPDLFSINMTLARVKDGTARYWEPAIAPNDTASTPTSATRQFSS